MPGKYAKRRSTLFEPAGRADVPDAQRFNIAGYADSPADPVKADDTGDAIRSGDADQASYRLSDDNA